MSYVALLHQSLGLSTSSFDQHPLGFAFPNTCSISQNASWMLSDAQMYLSDHEAGPAKR